MIKHTVIIPTETPRSVSEVDKLLQIERNSDFEIETKFELTNGQMVVGKIIEIEGYNPLVRDIFIPLNFILECKNHKIQRIPFNEIKLDDKVS